MNWREQPDALELLNSDGGPFESALYREALIRTVPGLTDLSWAATARDGTTAAVALAGSKPLADAIPVEGYGAIRSTRPLSAAEAISFLASARRGAGARRLRYRGVSLEGDGLDWSFARQIGVASVIPVDAAEDPSARYARLARRSVRKAQEAGCTARTTQDGEAFLELYRVASANWSMRYPEALVRELGRLGVARFDEVRVGERVVAGLMTLKAADHWMCWLAAQSDEGRELSASYLAYQKLLTDAGASVSFVNLGLSAPGTGGAEFKRRIGAVERPMYEWSTSGWVAKVNDARVRIIGNLRRDG